MKEMVKVLLMSLMVICLVQCETKQEEKGVKISGTTDVLLENNFAYLELVSENGVIPVDTINIENGEFKTWVEIKEPSLYVLKFNGKQLVSLILTGKEEEVVVNVHGNDPYGFSEVSGSYDTEYKNQMDELLKSFRSEAVAIQNRIRSAQEANDEVEFIQASVQLTSYTKNAEKQLKEIVWEATPSLAAIYGVQMLDADKNRTFLDSVISEVSKEIPDNYLVMNLVKKFEEGRKLAIGQEAPEISLPNPDGEIVKLSSLRGNYVLIDFWAAWCKPCRAENPNVVRMYNEYSSENFEIYGVSLDKTKEAWLKAIEQDVVPWIHVSDLKYWQSEAARLYNVGAIPATFLIDPEGKIIAKNLRGPSLEAKLKEIFG